MLAHEVDADLAAALERHVGELHPLRLLEHDGDDLVFLCRARAAHLHGAVLGLDGREILTRRLVRCLRVDPEDELVEGDARHRRHVFPAEGNARVERRGEEVREGDDDSVRVTLLALDVQEPLGARAPGFVHGDDRARSELVLLGDARNEAGHLVRAAARSRRDHELDGLGGLPGGRRRGGPHSKGADQHRPDQTSPPLTCHVLPSQGVLRLDTDEARSPRHTSGRDGGMRKDDVANGEGRTRRAAAARPSMDESRRVTCPPRPF